MKNAATGLKIRPFLAKNHVDMLVLINVQSKAINLLWNNHLQPQHTIMVVKSSNPSINEGFIIIVYHPIMVGVEGGGINDLVIIYRPKNFLRKDTCWFFKGPTS